MPDLEPYRARVARLWPTGAATVPRPAGTTETEPTSVGYLVTRVCTHWETVGPHAFPHHVNPQERLEWRIERDRHRDVFWDDGDAERDITRLLATWDSGHITIDGVTLRLEWLEGDDAARAWAERGW
ncbi:hypothetical protein [Oerskovia flava]|uniref:hypothetical protein n=1 Tax=Oerskovia flava TaxID=2986422 RepID=UPI00224072BB|nr:hypothetical protein [Oerskovia sp. JB1-3-2]